MGDGSLRLVVSSTGASAGAGGSCVAVEVGIDAAVRSRPEGAGGEGAAGDTVRARFSRGSPSLLLSVSGDDNRDVM